MLDDEVVSLLKQLISSLIPPPKEPYHTVKAHLVGQTTLTNK